MFDTIYLFLVFLAILIVILVLTIINYNKDVSGDFLPLSGGTMSGNIDAGNQSITNINNTATSNLSLNNRTILYGPDIPGPGSNLGKNLYVNNVALAPYVTTISPTLGYIGALPELNGEQWIISSSYGPPLDANTLNIPVNSTTTINQYLVTGGFYLSLFNRKASNITINVYAMSDPTTYDPLSPPSVTFTGTLPASSQRFLYWNGTAWSLQ
jgi:hypothetical protein